MNLFLIRLGKRWGRITFLSCRVIVTTTRFILYNAPRLHVLCILYLLAVCSLNHSLSSKAWHYNQMVLLHLIILLWLNLVINTTLISYIMIVNIIKILLEFLLNILIISSIAILLYLRIDLLVIRLLPKLIVWILIEMSLRLRNQNISRSRINSILSIWVFLICFLAPLGLLIWIIITSLALFSFRHIPHVILSVHYVLCLIILDIIVLLILVNSNLHF